MDAIEIITTEKKKTENSNEIYFEPEKQKGVKVLFSYHYRNFNCQLNRNIRLACIWIER